MGVSLDSHTRGEEGTGALASGVRKWTEEKMVAILGTDFIIKFPQRCGTLQ